MIKNATFTEDGTTIRVELEDGTVMWVPDDMANRHRVELEEWTKAGGQIAPYQVEPAAKLALGAKPKRKRK